MNYTDYTHLFLDNNENFNITKENLKIIKEKLQNAKEKNHNCKVTITVYEYYNSYLWAHFENILNNLKLKYNIIDKQKYYTNYNINL